MAAWCKAAGVTVQFCACLREVQERCCIEWGAPCITKRHMRRCLSSQTCCVWCVCGWVCSLEQELFCEMEGQQAAAQGLS